MSNGFTACRLMCGLQDAESSSADECQSSDGNFEEAESCDSVSVILQVSDFKLIL